MIDKVPLSIRIVYLVTLTLLASGCGFDRPLKKPTPNLVKVTTPSSENNDSPIQCSDRVSGAPKSVAILHIGVEHPEQTRYFPQFQQLFSKRLLERAQTDSTQHISDVSHITLKPQQVSLLGQVDSSMKSQIRQIGKKFNSQLIVNGTITNIELSHKDPRYTGKDDHLLDNLSEVFDKITDKLTKITWRKISFKLQVFNGHSGELITEHESEQKISLKSGEPFFLLTSPSDKERDEQRMIVAVDSLISQQIEIVDDVAFCTAVRGHVISTDNITATINIGAGSQVSIGDRFKLTQTRLLHTDANGYEQLAEEVVATLKITKVKSDISIGQIEHLTQANEINIGDNAVSQ